jgi:hypothetical protein
MGIGSAPIPILIPKRKKVMELQYLTEAIWQIIKKPNPWLSCVEPLWSNADDARISTESSRIRINSLGRDVYCPHVSIVQHGLWIYHLYLSESYDG